MWVDCWQVLVNLDKVDYISFDYEVSEDGDEIPTAYVYFTGREEPVLFHADNIDELQNYFAVWTLGRELDEQQEESTAEGSPE